MSHNLTVESKLLERIAVALEKIAGIDVEVQPSQESITVNEVINKIDDVIDEPPGPIVPPPPPGLPQVPIDISFDETVERLNEEAERLGSRIPIFNAMKKYGYDALIKIDPSDYHKVLQDVMLLEPADDD